MASRRKEFFPEVTDEQWNDWHWQVKNRIETLDQLKKYIRLTPDEEEGIRESLKTLRMAITPYYLSLIDPDNPYCPIRKQSVPTIEELHRSPADLEDPLHEDGDSPVPGLTHRYPDRVLFLITDMCSMYCRHCTRRRFAGHHDCATPLERIDKCIEYIANTPQVRDVLLSGGDALLVSDERLEYIIKRLRGIPHVEIIRIGSRTPVVLPAGIGKYASEISSDLAEYSFQPSERNYRRVGGCLCPAGRCGYTSGKSVCPAPRDQRLYTCHEKIGARVGQDPGTSLLHLYL